MVRQSTPETSTQHYPALDVLRGVAALAVVCTHAEWITGFRLLSQGYLAVDFFFILSGFVIAHAYEQRLSSGLTSTRFALQRLVRLYPMILLGVVLGSAVALWTVHPPIWKLAQAALAGLLLAPIDGMRQVGFGLWPVNPPSWSLAWELVANAVYAGLLFRLRTRWLVLIAATGWLGLMLCAALFGSLEVGFLPQHFWGGAARVAFAFSVGLILFRLSGRWPKGFNVWVLSAILLVVLGLPAGPSRAVFDLLAVTLVLPVLVAAAVKAPASAGVARLFGRVSYPLYIIHAPILLVGKHIADAQALPATGRLILVVAGVLVSILAAYVVLRFYDEPVRARLSAWLRRDRSTRLAPAEVR